jgi:hypothetical protein
VYVVFLRSLLLLPLLPLLLFLLFVNADWTNDMSMLSDGLRRFQANPVVRAANRFIRPFVGDGIVAVGVVVVAEAGDDLIAVDEVLIRTGAVMVDWPPLLDLICVEE